MSVFRACAVPSEMTEKNRSFASVFYDADCGFCVNITRRFERVLARRRFQLVPLQVRSASAEFGFREARVRGVASDRLRALAYMVAWPGMDAEAFLRRTYRPAQPHPSEWIAAALKTLLGATLIWVVARTAVPVNPLLAGWVGMVGLIFVLHFGTFHLLSLAWRSIGVNATPVMNNPLRSSSVAEFWGRRWNTAFHELATRFTFRP